MAIQATGQDVKDLHAEIERYQQRLTGQPESSIQTVPLHLTLGKLYERAGEKTSAIQEFARVALIYADQGNIIKAMAVAQLIVQLDPENDEILERLKDLFLMQKAVSETQRQEYQESMKHLDDLQNEQQGSEIMEDQAEDSVSEETAEEVIQALKQIPIFAKLSVSELRGIQTYSLLHHLNQGEPVLTGGNVRRSLFAILEGSVKILGKNKEKQEIFLATLKTGTSFGEFALFGRIDTDVSVIAEEPCRILEIPREIVMKIARMRPTVIEALKDLFRRRMLENALAKVPLFSQLAPKDRAKLVKHFKPVRAKQGAVLMREGKLGDSMYFIVAGEVGVYTLLDDSNDDRELNPNTDRLLLASLKLGDFFGEQALVTNNPRSATVIAHTDVALLKFSKTDLQAVIQEHPWIESELQIEAFENLMRKNISILSQIVLQ